MTESSPEPDVVLSPKLVALAFSGFGVIIIFAILAFTVYTPEIKILSMVAFGLFIPIWLYCGCLAVISETPEWSTNAMRANSIGSILMLAGLAVADITDSAVLGVTVTLVGIILILVSILHPNSQTKNLVSV